MHLSTLATGAFAGGFELRFGRQPIDVVREAGLEFEDIDHAALEAGASAGVGSMFVAELPGWGIVCHRPEKSVIRVLRMVRAGRRPSAAATEGVPDRAPGRIVGGSGPGHSERSGRGHGQSSVQGVAFRGA